MRKLPDKHYFLAGDIGGTKTNLGLFQEGKKRPVVKLMETYPSSSAASLEAIIEQFLAIHPVSINSACFGIAGPVQNGRCKATNLPWVVDETKIKNRFKFKNAILINDLTATALAIPFLNNRELYSVNTARAQKNSNLALIAPGTGLGQALLIWQRQGYIPLTSEGGHGDFAPANKPQVDLWRYLYQIFGHVSIERILSGPGLYNTYSWLINSGRYKEPAWLSKDIRETDPARVITESAINKAQPLCKAALDIFVSVLGAAAGNLALTGMATGGVYLGGGIPPKILPWLKHKTFLKAFTDKGRFKDLMEKIPVKVILNEKAALIGAASCATKIA